MTKTTPPVSFFTYIQINLIMANNTRTTRNGTSTIITVNELSCFSFNLNYPNVNPHPSKISTCKKCVIFSNEFNLEGRGANKKSTFTSNTPVCHHYHHYVITNTDLPAFKEDMCFNSTNNQPPSAHVEQPIISAWSTYDASIHVCPREIAGSDSSSDDLVEPILKIAILSTPISDRLSIYDVVIEVVKGYVT